MPHSQQVSLVTGLQGIKSRHRTKQEKVQKMGGRGRDAAHMARARARRAPFTDPRDGRIFRQIRFAFTLSRGEPLSTTKLLKWCRPEFGWNLVAGSPVT
jgi:hypothetical protein